MKVALVFPPQGHFTQPYLSLPSLTAYLQQQGIEDVTQIDASIESYDYFLSRDRLAKSLERVNPAEKMRALDAKEGLVYTDMEQYQLLSELELVGESLVESIDEAKAVLRDPDAFYDYERYLWAGRTVEQALRLFSAEYAPTKVTAHGFVMRYRVESSADIIAATQDEEQNPYIEFFREHTLPQLQELDPDLIGLSLTFPSQAIPAFTLARLIKEWKPSVHITIGGGLLAYTADKLASKPPVWDLIDSMVLLEGERPLHQLCEVVDGKRELREVTNLVFRDPATGEVIKNEQEQPLDIATPVSYTHLTLPTTPYV